MTAKFYINQDTQPKFFKARPVPYALRIKVEKELARLETDGSTIFTVGCPDSTCYQTRWIYQDVWQLQSNNCKTDNHPISRIENLFASLSGGKSFSKMDLASAYQQIMLHKALF